MLSPKRLVEKARKGILLIKADTNASSSYGCKGHFAVYTEDGVRFLVPLEFLQSPIFRELLKMSEDEFGLHGDRPITLPCNAAFMEYIISLLKRRMAKDVEGALLASLDANRCLASMFCKTGKSYAFFPQQIESKETKKPVHYFSAP